MPRSFVNSWLPLIAPPVFEVLRQLSVPLCPCKLMCIIWVSGWFDLDGRHGISSIEILGRTSQGEKDQGFSGVVPPKARATALINSFVSGSFCGNPAASSVFRFRQYRSFDIPRANVTHVVDPKTAKPECRNVRTLSAPPVNSLIWDGGSIHDERRARRSTQT